MLPSIISINSITVNFGGLKALNNVSFHIPEATVLGLIGPNGSGKSTLINVITGFQEQYSGEIHFLGNVIHGQNKVSLANMGLCRTFQTPRVLKDYSAIDNMLVSLYAPIKSNDIYFGKQTLKTTSTLSERKEFCRSILNKFAPALNNTQNTGTLSYGSLRIIELCMCLVRNPKIIFLDELTSGLNDSETDAISKTISKIASLFDIPIVIIDHKFSFIQKLCSRVIVLNEGSLIFNGNSNEVRSDEKVKEVYFGDVK